MAGLLRKVREAFMVNTTVAGSVVLALIAAGNRIRRLLRIAIRRAAHRYEQWPTAR